MKNGKYVLGLLVVALVCVSAAVKAQAPGPEKLSFTFHDVTISGATEVDSYAINNSNILTGDYIDSSGTQHGMTCKLAPSTGVCTSVTNIDDPNGTKTLGYGINSSGDVVGFYLNSNGLDQGFLYKGGNFTDIGPAGDVSQANGINDKGLIVGDYYDPNSGVEYGFLYAGKKYTQLAIPSASATVAWAINSKGWITVFETASGGGEPWDAYLTKDKGKKFTKIDVPGETYSVSHGINAADNICYTAVNSGGTEDGALYYGGKYYTFDDPSGTNTRADGLNSKLVMVGRYGSGPSGGNGGYGFVAVTKK